MKIIKNIIEFMLGTSIIWLPILATIIAEKLSEIITMDMIMTVVYISIPVLIIILIRMEIQEAKAERRRKRHGQIR
jgi:hypothetical protein|nr:MAG TPA: hypothetical protein [Caudoviricetes sp.]